MLRRVFQRKCLLVLDCAGRKGAVPRDIARVQRIEGMWARQRKILEIYKSLKNSSSFEETNANGKHVEIH